LSERGRNFKHTSSTASSEFGLYRKMGIWVSPERKCVTEFLFSGTPSTTRGFLLSVWFQLFLPFFFSPAATDLRFASSVCVNHSQETLKICLQNTRTPIDPEAERK
jgi:hypothetical protein